MRNRLIFLVPWFVWSCNLAPKTIVVEEVSLGAVESIDAPEKLSEWDLFKDLKTLEPSSRMLPYQVNSPLFSDYAHKSRFYFLPTESHLKYEESEVFQLPQGAVLVKHFYYPVDFSKPTAAARRMETRLLVHEAEGWRPLTYIWNEDQIEAYLEIGGRSIPVSWTDEYGELQRIDYSVPNLNQCKSCHERGGQLVPIGFTARQLNNEVDGNNQLHQWANLGVLEGLPEVLAPKLASWASEEESLDARARSWLETNCAHCHRRDGPAKNSGLYLLASEKDQYVLGINKPPVAAGRGSGGLKFAIFPGNPDRSILVHRIESLDPGVMMPELGRKLVHKEGVELVRAWIANLSEVNDS